jgi:LysR family glycine cleavage system transcriptional activator
VPYADNPSQSYTTTWFDTWRFVDGKADEHWDPATLPAGPAPQAAATIGTEQDRAAIAKLFDGLVVASPYSYWFVCRPVDLEQRAVRLFHDWLVEAGL